jgi:hypothetical protein
MTSNSSRQVSDCSCSAPTVVSERCEATLELGRQLTSELDLDRSGGTLGRWMAHYIAELILNAEEAGAEERPVKMKACCDAILSLWKHRHELAVERPFEELEPILSALDSLDPDSQMPRYFRMVREAAEGAEEADETKSWLKLAHGLDYSARLLIRYCLTQAAQRALDKSLEWVTLAKAAGADDLPESPVIRMIADESALLRATDLDDDERVRLEERIERLEEFSQMAATYATEMRRLLRQAEDASED